MKKMYEDIKKIFESKISNNIVYGIGAVILALIIFSAGVKVGFHKSSFGRDWGEHYNENFGMGRRSEKMGMMNYFPNAHGTTGKILKLEIPNILVQDKDNTEKVVATDDDTKIQKGSESITIADLKIDDFIVVIGTPNNKGQIEAKLIRVMPNPSF